MTADHSPSVLYVIRSLDRGGAERQLVAQAIGLRRRGYRVQVAVFYADGKMEPELTAANVPVLTLEKRSRYDVFGPLRGLSRQIRAERPDAVYSFMEAGNVFAALVSWLAPVPRLVWGVRTADTRYAAYGPGHVLLLWLTTILSHRADLVISNSHAGAAEHVRRGYSPATMRVIPNGIDTDRFAPDPAGAQALRASWKIQPAERVVGLVGRIDPMKDHPNCFRAIARLRDSGVQVRLICAGVGSRKYVERMKAYASSLRLADMIEWIDHPSSMPALYSSLDVLCSASAFGEGFSNAVGEAMACGTPCVVTDVGDSRVIVGEYGIVVAPEDDAALADGISRALTSVDSATAARSRMRIVQDFGLEALVSSTASCLWPDGG